MIAAKGAYMQNELDAYLEAIKEDYRRSSKPIDSSESAITWDQAMIQEFNNGLTIEEGKVYFKVISAKGSSRSVHSFIVKEDGVKFKRGDILKPAGWNAPAKNQARGNIFGQYHINWTGPDYLR